MPEAARSSPSYEATRRKSSGCRPASPRDWLAAHARVRFGRLNRFAAVRGARDMLVRLLAREGTAILFLTSYGFQILLPASYTSLIIMALDGVLFHPGLLELSRRVIRTGDIVVDGGSNIGFFALFAASLLGGKGRVFAFEPDTQSFLLLKRNVESNGLTGTVQLEEKALTDANGSFEFSVSVQEPMLSSLVARTDVDSQVIRVQGTRLDDYFEMNGVKKADVIKLDLEGAEPQALDGMTSILASARLIIFEVNEPQLAAIGVDPVALIIKTAARGTFETILFIDERTDQICGWDPDKFREALHAYKYVNVLCAKQGAISPLP
jgi:FkbM family methyltransferase